MLISVCENPLQDRIADESEGGMTSAARSIVRWANAMAERVERTMPPASLDLEKALERARCATNLQDFGEESFREPLARLIDALEREAQLSPLGRVIARFRIHGHLVNRLRIVADREREPSIARERIQAPLIIVGPPRTGTSILFRTLAQDERALSPLAWKLQFPSPPPPRHPKGIDRRFLRVRANEIFLNGVIPDLRKVYETQAELPEECVVLKGHEFTTIMFSIAYSVPSYEAWLLDCDQRPAYDWHEWLLQQLQWNTGGGHWVLKSPEHLLSLDCVFEKYPDACLVQTHRDPLEIVPSLASLTRILRSLSSERIDKTHIGREVAGFWAEVLDRAEAFRAAHPELQKRFLDVRFEEICEDPLAVIRRIYVHFGRELTHESEEGMKRFLRRNPRGKHGEHHYTLEEYGLRREDVVSRFENYRRALGYTSEADQLQRAWA